MWIGRGEDTSVMAILLGNVRGGNEASETIEYNIIAWYSSYASQFQ